eukprot:scaffold731_cov261-Pinguiococcus_pyrenoidosus.AAC.16
MNFFSQIASFCVGNDEVSVGHQNLPQEEVEAHILLEVSTFENRSGADVPCGSFLTGFETEGHHRRRQGWEREPGRVLACPQPRAGAPKRHQPGLPLCGDAERLTSPLVRDTWIRSHNAARLSTRPTQTRMAS